MYTLGCSTVSINCNKYTKHYFCFSLSFAYYYFPTVSRFAALVVCIYFVFNGLGSFVDVCFLDSSCNHIATSRTHSNHLKGGGWDPKILSAEENRNGCWIWPLTIFFFALLFGCLVFALFIRMDLFIRWNPKSSAWWFISHNQKKKEKICTHTYTQNPQIGGKICRKSNEKRFSAMNCEYLAASKLLLLLSPLFCCCCCLVYPPFCTCPQ